MLRTFFLKKRGFTLVELMISIAVIAILAAALLPALARARESARRSNCQENLKRLGELLDMYVDDDPNAMYPPDTPTACFYVPCPPFFPEYLKDVTVLLCPSDPSAVPETYGRLATTHKGQYGDVMRHNEFTPGDIHPDCLHAESYTYVSNALTYEPAGFYHVIGAMVVAQIMETLIPVTNEFLMGHFVIPDTWGKTTLYGPGPACTNLASYAVYFGASFATSGNVDKSWLCQLRVGIDDMIGVPTADGGYRSGHVERGKVVLMFDQVSTVAEGFNHAPALSNILFLDGHVEPALYDPEDMLAKYPLHPTFAAIVGGYILHLMNKDIPVAHPDCF